MLIHSKYLFIVLLLVIFSVFLLLATGSDVRLRRDDPTSATPVDTWLELAGRGWPGPDRFSQVEDNQDQPPTYDVINPFEPDEAEDRRLWPRKDRS